MAVRLPDTAEPMGNFAGMMAKHIECDDGERLQDKIDNGSLGGGGGGYTQLSQAEYDALTDDEKMNGKEYRTYDSGHIYKLNVSYGKDAYFTSLEQLGLTAPTTVGDIFNAMPGKSMAVIACEGIEGDTSGADVHVSDVPVSFGVLTIKRGGIGRFSIDYQNSLFGSPCNVKRWIGTLKGLDGTGLKWKQINTGNHKYTTMGELGLEGATATIQDVIDKVAVGDSVMLRTDAFNNNNWNTQCNGIQWGYLKIEKTINGLSNIELQEVVVPNRRYFGTQSSGKFVGWVPMNTNEILHTDLSGNLAGITTVLDLVNALLTEYRALNQRKPIRFVSGEFTKTNLTDLPVAYGLLQITVAGWDVVEVRLAHSANGFKSMYYGFLTRISGQESISSIAWKKVAITTVTTLAELGLTSSATVDDVHNKLEVGQMAILPVQAFDNYQTLFPYADSDDKYSRIEIQKGESVAHSRIFWWRKDGSKFAVGDIDSNNKLRGWNEYALKSYVDSKIADLQAQINALK